MEPIQIKEVEVDGHPEIGLNEGKISLFDKMGEFTPLTQEELDSWKNKKYPWYKTLWWAIRRIPDKIDFILSPKYKLEKEHKQIGFGYWDRPLKKYDVWNLSNHMAWVLYAQLVRFKRSERSGLPGFIEFEGYTMEVGLQKWEEILDKMIYSFQEIINDDFHFDTAEEYEVYYNKIQEGLNLFGQYYRGLWD